MRRGNIATLSVVFVSIWLVGGNAYAGGETPAAAPSTAAPPAAATVPAAGASADAAVKASAVAAYNAKNYREAMRLFRPLADKGDPDAQYHVGRMYEKGQGVWKDQEQVVAWYTRAAEGGHAGAQYRLAVGYAYGFAGLEQDEKRAGTLLQSAAEGGHKKAQKYLGRAYAEGRFGFKRDPAKAEYWTKKSQQK